MFTHHIYTLLWSSYPKYIKHVFQCSCAIQGSGFVVCVHATKIERKYTFVRHCM